MKKANLLIITAIALASLTACVDNSWQAANKKYQEQFAQKQYSEAEQTATEVLDMAKKEFGAKSFCVAVCLNNLSRAHEKLGQTKESKQYFSKALEMTEDLMDNHDPKIAKALRGATQGNPNAEDPFADFNLNTDPWIKWGNSPMDHSSPNERLEIFYRTFLPIYLEQDLQQPVQQPVQQPKPQTIVITSEGYYVGQEVYLEDLSKFLNPEEAVVLAVEKGTKHERIILVMDECAEAGIKDLTFKETN